jgi:hypothetical protein
MVFGPHLTDWLASVRPTDEHATATLVGVHTALKALEVASVVGLAAAAVVSAVRPGVAAGGRSFRARTQAFERAAALVLGSVSLFRFAQVYQTTPSMRDRSDRILNNELSTRMDAGYLAGGLLGALLGAGIVGRALGTAAAAASFQLPGDLFESKNRNG